MANRINDRARREIVQLAAKHGFQYQVREDGRSRYDKNLVFESSKFPSKIYVHMEIGYDDELGNPVGTLRVAVDPKSYTDAHVDEAAGISAGVNRKTKQNLFSSSHYVGFPTYPGNEEPCGKCYSVDAGRFGLEPLSKLFTGLANTGPAR